jgi:hypothetical protein
MRACGSGRSCGSRDCVGLPRPLNRIVWASAESPPAIVGGGERPGAELLPEGRGGSVCALAGDVVIAGTLRWPGGVRDIAASETRKGKLPAVVAGGRQSGSCSVSWRRWKSKCLVGYRYRSYRLM